jgi:hypothetical protein
MSRYRPKDAEDRAKGDEVAQAEGQDVKAAAHEPKREGDAKGAEAKAGDGKDTKDARAEKPKKKKKRRKKAAAEGT